MDIVIVVNVTCGEMKIDYYLTLEG